jgi:multicomponent Na+:H+ antiporter subunit F
MNGATAILWASQIGLGMILIGIVLVVIRLIRGPGLSDRILALDLITVLSTGFVGVITVLTGFSLYLDIAIALALVSFLSTVALARYLMARSVGQRKRKGEQS